LTAHLGMVLARSWHPAARGPQVVLTTFLWDCSHDLGISQWEKGNRFLLLRTTDVNTYILSEHKSKQLQKKKNSCRSSTLESCYWARVPCSIVQIVWDSTKQFDSYCTINTNWSFIKLTVTWNQNWLKDVRQRLYNKLSCMEKYSHYPFSSEYQPYCLS
jgi:hypothetical protein